jgi:hypothetical protein
VSLLNPTYHWKAKGPVPVASTTSVTLAPAATDWLAGCTVIDGATGAVGGGVGSLGAGAEGGLGSPGERGDDRVQAVIDQAIASRHAASQACREQALALFNVE